MARKEPGVQAAERLAEGHTVLIWELEVGKTWNGGQHVEHANTIEQIELAGWKLDSTVINGNRWQLVFRARPDTVTTYSVKDVQCLNGKWNATYNINAQSPRFGDDYADLRPGL